MAVRFNAGGEFYKRDTNLPVPTSFTVMAWVYFVANNNTGVWFSLDDGTNFINSYCNGALFRMFSTGFGQGSGSTITLDTWYHLAITCSGTAADTLKLYVNGVEDISQTGASFTPNRMLLGDYNEASGGPFDGRLAAVKLWDAALSAVEVAAEMAFYAPQRTSNLHAWYPMRDTTEAPDDFSANGYDWTVAGAPSTEDGPPDVEEPSSGSVLYDAIGCGVVPFIR